MIIAMAGLPGTGKSTVAAALARALSATVLDKDRIRPALFGATGVSYTREQDDFCVDVMLRTGAFLLTRNPQRTVILDGRTHSRAYQVRQVRDLAERLATPLHIIECVCRDDLSRRRIEADLAAGRHPAGNRTPALRDALQTTADPITGPKLVLDTARELTECVASCLAYLQRSRIGA